MITVRLSDELHATIKQLATTHNRSMNQLICDVLLTMSVDAPLLGIVLGRYAELLTHVPEEIQVDSLNQRIEQHILASAADASQRAISELAT